MMFGKIIGLAVAGTCGTLARYYLSGSIHRWLGSAFPWGTALVNVLGCAFFGFLWAVASEKTTMSPEMRTILLVGFLGAFTTFSTFISESSQLVLDGELLIGLANIAFQVLTGMVLFCLGLAAGRAI